jgi:hypothetical protein
MWGIFIVAKQKAAAKNGAMQVGSDDFPDRICAA